MVTPSARYLPSKIRFVDDIEVNRHPNGASRARQFGLGYWQADIGVAPMDREALGKWDAFFLKHGSAKSVVRLFHPNQCTPVSYKGFAGVDVAGGGQFSGAGNLFARTDAFNVTVSNCPSLFKLKCGDWVGFEIDDRFSLHQIVEDATGSAGGVVSIEVFPAIPARFVVGAVVRFKEPVGEFLLTENSDVRQRVGTKTSLRFSAMSQV